MFLVRSCKSLGLFVWNMVLLAFWVADILLIICGHAKGRVWPGNQQARLAPCQMPVVNSIINKTPKTTVTILWSYQLSQNERSQRKRWYTCNISHHTLKLYQPNFGIWDGFLLLSSHQQLLSSPGSLGSMGSMGSTLPPRHPEPRDATRQWCRSWCPSRWYAPASRERRPRLPWGGTSAAVFFQKKKVGKLCVQIILSPSQVAGSLLASSLKVLRLEPSFCSCSGSPQCSQWNPCKIMGWMRNSWIGVCCGNYIILFLKKKHPI